MNYIKNNLTILFGIIFYLSIIIFINYFPLNFNGIIVSYEAVCCDYNFHKKFGILLTESFVQIFFEILDFWTGKKNLLSNDDIYPGFIYPLILNFLSYLDIKFLNIFISLLLTVLTLINFNKILLTHRHKNLKLLIIILIPYQIYFTIFFPSDILFSYFMSLYLYEISKGEKLSNLKLLTVTSLLIFCKPNGLISLIFSIFLILRKKKINLEIFYLVSLLIISIFYYGPYIFSYFKVSINIFANNSVDSNSLTNQGLFHQIIFYLSGITNYILKLFYSLGIRPSLSGNDFVAGVRIFFGIFFLIGFFWAIINARDYLNLFILIYFFLGINGIIVERYFFSLYPILMINFCDVILKISDKINDPNRK